MTALSRFFSPKQLDSIRNSNNKINIWEGAVRSGKTYASLWRLVDECRNGPPGQFAILCRTYDTFKRNLLPDLYNIMGSSVQYQSGKRELHIGTRLVHVIGADDERAEAKIRGPTFAGIYMDELSILPESVVKMALSRASITGSKIFATTNPDSPLHYIKRDFLSGNNSDVTSFQFLMEDNPSLTDDYKAFLRRQYKGIWYQRYIEGKWVQAEGAIYDMFTQQEHIINNWPDRVQEYVVGVDYGTANPCAFVMVGYHPTGFPMMWAEKEYYWDSVSMQRQKTDYEYANDLREFIEGKRISAIYIDPSAASFQEELRRTGFFDAIPAENEVLGGIRFVSQLFSQGTLKIMANCTHLIEEIQGYTWDPKSSILGKDKPIKSRDHLCDALRYCAFSHFYYHFHPRASDEDLRRMEETYRPRTALRGSY